MNNKGFTMAELLIVLAIIAVLVAIAVPVFISQKKKGNESTDRTNNDTVEKVEKQAVETSPITNEADDTAYDRLDQGEDINISSPESASIQQPIQQPIQQEEQNQQEEQQAVEAPNEQDSEEGTQPVEPVEPVIQVGDPGSLNLYY